MPAQAEGFKLNKTDQTVTLNKSYSVVWGASNKLRWFRPLLEFKSESGGDLSYYGELQLQQLWLSDKGEEEWRSIEVVNGKEA